MGIISDKNCKFYISSCILAVEHLHKRGIIHRDLKPENIMVNKKGYIKLIDMGIAKIVKGNQKTFTVTGTPNYTAPEIAIGKGYGNLVDLWSIGVMMYEFLVGYMPFGETAEDPF
jgi:cGMP-dependent protein kinase